ncbi:hypothetical protein [Hyphomicrobium sp. 99]
MLAYMAQAVVAGYGWLKPDEMLCHGGRALAFRGAGDREP